MSLTVIKDQIRKLPSDQLREISDYCSFLQQEKGKGSSVDESLLYDTINNHLKQVIKSPSPPYAAFKKTSFISSYQKCRKFLDAFISQCLGGEKVNRVTKLKFYQFFAQLMSEHINMGPAPLSMATILKQHQNFPGVMDNAFPGYCKSRHALQFLLNSRPIL